MKLESWVDLQDGNGFVQHKIGYWDISTEPEQILVEIIYPTQIRFSYLGKDYIATFSPGYTTDFGSVPKAVRGGISNTGAINIIYMLHDGGYGIDWPKMCPAAAAFTREDIDTLLYLGLKERGMSDIKADLVYDAVRVAGGGSHWRHSA